jgi:hypothetical protein
VVNSSTFSITKNTNSKMSKWWDKECQKAHKEMKRAKRKLQKKMTGADINAYEVKKENFMRIKKEKIEIYIKTLNGELESSTTARSFRDTLKKVKNDIEAPTTTKINTQFDPIIIQTAADKLQTR